MTNLQDKETHIIRIGFSDAPRCFTLSEARETLKMVKPITARSHQDLEELKARLRHLLPSDPRIVSVEQEYEAVVRKWISKMKRLGLVVRGLWLLDFDSGDGYFCWKHPELTIDHFHSYDGGFVERRPLAEVIAENHPDWADIDGQTKSKDGAKKKAASHQRP